MIPIQNYVGQYCCNAATQRKFKEDATGMQRFYENATSTSTEFYETIHRCFEASFGSVYTLAIEPHSQAYSNIDPERTQSTRNVLRYTPYIYANVSFSTARDGPTHICTHVDKHTKKNLQWTCSCCLASIWSCPTKHHVWFPYIRKFWSLFGHQHPHFHTHE